MKSREHPKKYIRPISQKKHSQQRPLTALDKKTSVPEPQDEYNGFQESIKFQRSDSRNQNRNGSANSRESNSKIGRKN